MIAKEKEHVTNANDDVLTDEDIRYLKVAISLALSSSDIHEMPKTKVDGVVTYNRKSEEYRSDIVVIPIEIEVPTEIDSFTKFEILNEYGRTYKSWIQQCYLHRMKEILTNPTEFGRVVLEEKKRDHCIQNADLEDY